MGVFEAYLNGKKLGEEFLAPYVNNYEANIQVLTFPVEELAAKMGKPEKTVWNFCLEKAGIWVSSVWMVRKKITEIGWQ